MVRKVASYMAVEQGSLHLLKEEGAPGTRPEKPSSEEQWWSGHGGGCVKAMEGQVPGEQGVQESRRLRVCVCVRARVCMYAQV